MYQISVQRLLLSTFVSLMPLTSVAIASDQPSISNQHNRFTIIAQSSSTEKARYEIIKGYINADSFNEALAFTNTIANKTEKFTLLVTLSQWARRSGKLDISYQIANQILDSTAKIQALTEVSIAYSYAKQQQKAVSILSDAYQMARSQKDQSLVRWVGNFAKIRAFDRALTIANSLKDYEQGDARLAIARGYANAGQYAKAISMVQLVKDGQLRVMGDIPDPKVDTVNQIVRQAAKARQYELAIKAANSFSTGEYRVTALQIIAQQYQITKQPQKAAAVLEQALKVARTVDKITIFYDRNTSFSLSNAGLLLGIARNYVQLNQRDRTIAILNETLNSAQTLKQKNVSSVREQIKYLNAIAKLYKNLGQNDRALATAESALNILGQLPTSVDFPSWQVEGLADVAQIFHIAGAGNNANQLLTTALSLSDTIKNKQQRLWGKVAIIKAYATLEQEQQVKNIVEAALKLAQTLEPSQRDWLADRILVAGANSYTFLQLRQTFPDPVQQIHILAQIAVNYHANSQDAQAQGILINAEQIAQTLPDHAQRDQILNNIVRDYLVPVNARDISISQLLQAGQMNAQIKAARLKADNWSLIARSYALQGEVGRAGETMGFALDVSRTIADRFERRDFLWQIFEDALGLGEWSLAAQIANSFEQKSDRSTALMQVQAMRN